MAIVTCTGMSAVFLKFAWWRLPGIPGHSIFYVSVSYLTTRCSYTLLSNSDLEAYNIMIGPIWVALTGGIRPLWLYPWLHSCLHHYNMHIGSTSTSRKLEKITQFKAFWHCDDGLFTTITMHHLALMLLEGAIVVMQLGNDSGKARMMFNRVRGGFIGTFSWTTGRQLSRLWFSLITF